MKAKYIEERFPAYFVWGAGIDDQVDIATITDDTVATVSLDHADKLIQHRDELLQYLRNMTQAFEKAAPEEFERFWYGHPQAQPEPEPTFSHEDITYTEDIAAPFPHCLYELQRQ